MKKIAEIAACAVMIGGVSASLLYRRHQALVLTAAERRSLHDAVADCASGDVACVIAETKKETAGAQAAAKAADAPSRAALQAASDCPSSPQLDKESAALKGLLASSWGHGYADPGDYYAEHANGEGLQELNAAVCAAAGKPKDSFTDGQAKNWVRAIVHDVFSQSEMEAEGVFLLSAGGQASKSNPDVQVKVFRPHVSIHSVEPVASADQKTLQTPEGLSEIATESVCPKPSTPKEWDYVVQLVDPNRVAPTRAIMISNNAVIACAQKPNN